MRSEENQRLERFIQDWHWDEQSHQFARDIGSYLFQFIDHLYEEGLSEKTIRRHRGNCWCIGILECQYGYRDEFSPGAVFGGPRALHEIEFKRKVSESNYAINSYRATWRKVYRYTKASGYLENVLWSETC